MSSLPSIWPPSRPPSKHTPVCRMRRTPRDEKPPLQPPNSKKGPACTHPPIRCANCNTPHKASDPNCPERIKLRTCQNDHEHDYNQQGRHPHGGSSRLNGPTRRRVRTDAELCERPSDYDFSTSRFRQKTRKPYLSFTRTMVGQTWISTFTTRIRHLFTLPNKTQMCDIYTSHTWSHRYYSLYSSGLILGNHDYNFM